MRLRWRRPLAEITIHGACGICDLRMKDPVVTIVGRKLRLRRGGQVIVVRPGDTCDFTHRVNCEHTTERP